MTKERKAELFDSAMDWVYEHCPDFDAYVRAVECVGLKFNEACDYVLPDCEEDQDLSIFNEVYPDEADFRECAECGRWWPRADMSFTRDCHGIPFRIVCPECYENIMEKGYDGEYYTEADEQIEDDY